MTHHLLIRGYGRRDPEGAQELSKATGLALPDARVCLGSRFPRLVGSHPDLDAAVEGLAALAEHGFEGFIASDEEVEKPPEIATAGRAELSETSVSWWHAERERPAAPDLGIIQDRTILQNREHVRAILRGSVRWQSRTETQTTRTSDVGHGVPLRETRMEASSLQGDRDQILLVKGAGHDRFVLVSERSFDFSCLGSAPLYGPGARIGRLQALLREIFPEAFFDDTLMKFTGDMGFSFRTARSGTLGPSVSESSTTDHSSNFDSVVRMARLLSMQHGLA